MSARIFNREETASLELKGLNFEEWGTNADAHRGTQKLILPDVSLLEDLHLEFDPSRNSVKTPGELLDEARRQANSLISEAEARGKEIEESALSNAMASFDEKLELALTEKMGELRIQYQDTIERLDSLEVEMAKKVERDLVGLALAVSKKVIGQEIKTDREIVLNMLNKALEKLRDRSLAEIHVNPEDLDFVEANRARVNFRGALELIPDPSISIGGCLIRTKTGDIDARIKSQFEELSHGLLDA